MNTFSIRERQIIKILGYKRLGIEEISNQLFKDVEMPLDASILVGNSIRRIIKKCDYYDLKWTLGKLKKGNKIFVKRIKLQV